MTARHHTTPGVPCWADLWTSDIDASRAFYREVLGWEATDPVAEFNGYFQFLRNGEPVAGAMGDMGEGMKADNTWKPYFASDDIDATAAALTAQGMTLFGGAHPVGDLGFQLVCTDQEGAHFGVWQPGTFNGFSVVEEHGAPSWFELHTPAYASSIERYRAVFGWDMTVHADSDEFRYSTGSGPDGYEVVGVMDLSVYAPPGTPAVWDIYWEVDDIDAAFAHAVECGATVVEEPGDSPHGWLGVLSDPTGTTLKLRTQPS